MGKISTILFDLDGTLIDSRADLSSAVNHALESVGLARQSPDEIVPHVGNGLRVLLSEVMGPVSDEILAKATSSFSSFYDEHCVDETVLYEDVHDVLQHLSSTHRMGIVTNKPEAFARKIIERLGVSGFIATILGGDSLPQRKPHPAPVFKALQNLDGHPEKTLIVGDGIQDIQAGQSAGVFTCIARYGYGFRSESLVLNPQFQIKRFIELKEIVS